MPLFKLSISTFGLEAGGAASDLLTELAEPRALAVTLFEDGPASFLIEAYYESEPSLEAAADALSALRAGLGEAMLEAVPEQNWVALSQAALPPIAAGRFVVHGGHDRARVGARRTAIEIEASGFAHPLLRPPRAFDLVLANLLPGPLVELAPAMRRALRPGGVAVLSGILDHQAREVGASYCAAGFRLLARSRRAGWTVLTLVRVTPHSTRHSWPERTCAACARKLLKPLAALGYTVDIKPPTPPTSQLSFWLRQGV